MGRSLRCCGFSILSHVNVIHVVATPQNDDDGLQPPLPHPVARYSVPALRCCAFHGAFDVHAKI